MNILKLSYVSIDHLFFARFFILFIIRSNSYPALH